MRAAGTIWGDRLEEALESDHQILSQIQQGDSAAAEKLLPLVYRELRRLAAARLAQEHGKQKPDATSLVHQAYLRLVGGGAQPDRWQAGPRFSMARLTSRGDGGAVASSSL